jgi:hypothetical protein
MSFFNFLVSRGYFPIFCYSLSLIRRRAQNPKAATTIYTNILHTPPKKLYNGSFGKRKGGGPLSFASEQRSRPLGQTTKRGYRTLGEMAVDSLTFRLGGFSDCIFNCVRDWGCSFVHNERSWIEGVDGIRRDGTGMVGLGCLNKCFFTSFATIFLFVFFPWGDTTPVYFVYLSLRIDTLLRDMRLLCTYLSVWSLLVFLPNIHLTVCTWVLDSLVPFFLRYLLLFYTTLPGMQAGSNPVRGSKSVSYASRAVGQHDI